MAVDRRAAESPENDRTDLEVWLRVKGPDFLRRNAANIILVVAVLIALGFLLYTRQRNKNEESLAVRQHVAAAFDYATQLRDSLAAAGLADAGRERQQRAQDALNAADVVLGSEHATSAHRAIAQLVKADVYWALANAPAGAIASTQPISTFVAKSSEAYLADAESAYGDVLRNYPDEPEPVSGALLGLAAIAENRRDFDAAAKWYQRAIDEASVRPAYRDAARGRLAMLDELRKPVTLAATRPAVEDAASQPSTATQPMIFRTPEMSATSMPTTAPAATSAPTSRP